MIIHSQALKNALCAVVSYYTGENMSNSLLTIPAPYRVLVHHMKELELYKFNQPKSHDEAYAEMTATHIDVLLSFLGTTVGKRIEEEKSRWARPTPTATFDNFWMLLKPGEVIYKKEFGFWVPYVVSQVFHKSHDRRNGRSRRYSVECWNYDGSDGTVERQMNSFDVYFFGGEQAIQSLPVVPAPFFPGGAKAAAEKQIKLGKLYWELAKQPAYKEYDGEMIGKDGYPKGRLNSRVIVDTSGPQLPSQRLLPPPATHSGRVRCPMPMDPIPVLDQLPQFKPRCRCAACAKENVQEVEEMFAGFRDLNPAEDEPPESDLFFLVLTDIIQCFVLSQRRWALLKIEHLKDIKADREAFKYLVLEDETKLAVKSLAGRFAKSDGKLSPWPNDIVKNKGVGRIFLLHGPPGVGKTCTAECVAELTQRPLLSLTSGDIGAGNMSYSVERNLEYFLQLGERYGALVLIDEADVFLEQRRTRDLHRNGLVSIFLRALEYYKGALFLTTNRIHAFDSAFTSRIHVALHYPDLNDDDRRRIWTNNFERLERDSAARCYISQSTREFAYSAHEVRQLQFNGREIRNALQTAVALAETEAEQDGVETVTVTDAHLKTVINMSRGFKEFLGRGVEYEEEDSESGDDDDDSSVLMD